MPIAETGKIDVQSSSESLVRETAEKVVRGNIQNLFSKVATDQELQGKLSPVAKEALGRLQGVSFAADILLPTNIKDIGTVISSIPIKRGDEVVVEEFLQEGIYSHLFLSLENGGQISYAELRNLPKEEQEKIWTNCKGCSIGEKESDITPQGQQTPDNSLRKLAAEADKDGQREQEPISPEAMRFKHYQSLLVAEFRKKPEGSQGEQYQNLYALLSVAQHANGPAGSIVRLAALRSLDRANPFGIKKREGDSIRNEIQQQREIAAQPQKKEEIIKYLMELKKDEKHLDRGQAESLYTDLINKEHFTSLSSLILKGINETPEFQQGVFGRSYNEDQYADVIENAYKAQGIADDEAKSLTKKTLSKLKTSGTIGVFISLLVAAGLVVLLSSAQT